MTEIVISKFSSDFLTKAVIFVLFVVACVIGYIVLLMEHWPSFNWGPLSFITLYLLLIIYFLFRISVYSLVRITVAPDCLSWKNLVTKKMTMIAYQDIVHVTNYKALVRARKLSGYLRLQIELSSNEQLSFTSLQFENYYELKNAIWECRQLHPATGTAADS